MKKVLVVDNHCLVRAGLCALVQRMPGFAVAAETDTAEATVDLARRNSFDVVAMEWNLPGIGGIEAVRRLRACLKKPRILVVTNHYQDPFPSQLSNAGALGFMAKSARVHEFQEALMKVANGERYLCPTVAQSMATGLLASDARSPAELLSKRELQVMVMSANGLRVRDISRALCLSPKTVSTHRQRLFEKLGVQSDAALARLALRYGLVEMPMSLDPSRQTAGNPFGTDLH